MSEEQPCPLSETNSTPDVASTECAPPASNGGTGRRIGLPKLLIENCNYEQVKKLSFQKLNELTRSSTQLIGSSTEASGNSADTSELSKSKSLTNLKSLENLADENGLRTSNADNGQPSSVEDLKMENDRLSATLKNIEKEHAEQQERASKELEELKANHAKEIEKINRQHDKTRRELENIVIKYAMSEKQILDAQKLKNDFERKMKDALKDKDSLMVRIKGLSNEKQSLMSALEGKVNEIGNGQKEVEKIRKQLKEKEAQLMQFEFKLNKEQESQSETSRKLESSLKTIEDLNKELSAYRETNGEGEQEMTSINKSELDGKCKEIVELRARCSELEEQKQSQAKRIKQLEQENGKFEEDRRRLSDAVSELKQEFIICNEKIEAGRLLKIEYDEKVEALEQAQQELENLRTENEELVCESKAYRQKEGELLEFTDRLQTKTIQLQSEHNHYKQRCGELEAKFSELQDTINRQAEELRVLSGELSAAKEQHENELGILARKLAEESNTKEKLRKQREELENENKIMKKKHLTSIKELNKELIVLRRKVEQSEQQSNSANQEPNSSGAAQHPSQETISLGSRTDSSNSLTAGSLDRTPNGESSGGHNENGDPMMRAPPANAQILLNPNFASPGDIAASLDKNVLLNKILSLQQQLAKLRSRVEFLEEHNQTLLEDIKKKSKLIQNFILREEAGALSCNDFDAFKSQVSRKGSGSLMASLYKNSVSDSNMTLDLSLEINRKLQSVLEDTILKNITLKENLDTLGSEIEKMSKKEGN